MANKITKANGHIVQSDWAQTDETQMDYIHNKPENITTVTVGGEPVEVFDADNYVNKINITDTGNRLIAQKPNGDIIGVTYQRVAKNLQPQYAVPCYLNSANTTYGNSNKDYPVLLTGYPTKNLHAANMQYVDEKITDVYLNLDQEFTVRIDGAPLYARVLGSDETLDDIVPYHYIKCGLYGNEQHPPQELKLKVQSFQGFSKSSHQYIQETGNLELVIDTNSWEITQTSGEAEWYVKNLDTDTVVVAGPCYLYWVDEQDSGSYYEECYFALESSFAYNKIYLTYAPLPMAKAFENIKY